MNRVITPAHTETVIHRAREFRFVDDPHAGFGFTCDEHGNPTPTLPEPAQRNFDACLTGAVRGAAVTDLGVVEHEQRVRHGATIRCDCGEVVVTNPYSTFGDGVCDCGRRYNTAGQELAPMDEWGEETGERPSDFLVDHDPEDV